MNPQVDRFTACPDMPIVGTSKVGGESRNRTHYPFGRLLSRQCPTIRLLSTKLALAIGELAVSAGIEPATRKGDTLATWFPPLGYLPRRRQRLELCYEGPQCALSGYPYLYSVFKNFAEGSGTRP